MLNTLLGRTTESPEVKAARLRLELAQTELILAQSGHNEGAIFNSDTGRSTGESGLFDDDDDVESAADNDSATLLGATIHYSGSRESQVNVPRARARRWLPSALTSTRSPGITECSKYEDRNSSDKDIEMSSFEVDEIRLVQDIDYDPAFEARVKRAVANNVDSEYESEEENGVNTHYPISMYLFGVAVVVAVVVSIVVVLLTQGNNSNNGDAPWADAFHTGHNRKGN